MDSGASRYSWIRREILAFSTSHALLAKFLGDVCLEGFLPIRRVVPGVLDFGDRQGGMRRTRADRGLRVREVLLGRDRAHLVAVAVGLIENTSRAMSAQLLTAPEPVRSYVPNGAPESNRWKTASAMSRVKVRRSYWAGSEKSNVSMSLNSKPSRPCSST